MSATNTNIRRAAQSLTPGDLIILYTIDLSPIGENQTFSFCKENGVRFRGVPYTPVDVTASGFEYNGQGSMPQPKIAIGNATRIMSSAAALYQDLVGARLYRMKTYRQFLDDGDTPDTDAMYDVDIYDFEQKTGHDNTQLAWTLSSAMDQEGRLLPGRVVLQSLCTWRYRRWNKNTGAFDYSNVQCPYTGAPNYDKDGNRVVGGPNDRCGRRISDCKVRFGANAELPYGGFPGVARVRI